MRRILASLAVLALAALVAAGCGSFGSVYDGDEDAPASKSDTVAKLTDEKFTDKVAKRDGCGEIKEEEMRGREHVEEDVDYKDNPPASGNHSATPLDWGVYDDEQDDEHWIHNLEHGHVVVLYKGLSKDEYKKLLALRDKSKYHVLLMPRKKNPKDGVYMVAWTHTLHCEKVSAAALQEFKSQFLDQGPELLMNDRPAPEPK